ncbi:MAG TPA: M20/M25/M40 family metallo-hydrolase [Thermoanaerobaculia bacterium]|nr:M20/M25/M40 family metallo-hydrolase [Thermoanaerobaculia bacterium]
MNLPRSFAVLLAFALVAGPALAAPATSPTAQEAKAIDTELVACGTRHSMSSWTDPKRGIGCARDLVVRRLEAIAAKSGGRLKVIVDKYETTAPRTGNVAVPMENVYGVLEGTDPVRKKTVYVMSGHLDSRASDIMDSKIDAPGADDDASGVIVSILSAAALAPKADGFRATLIFAAVAGEEQGLLGAKRMKEWLAQQGYEVGGMITNDIVGATNGSKDRRPRVFSEGGPDGVDSPGRQMARRLDELAGPARVRLVLRHDRFGRGGDHLPFAEAGLPAIRVTEPLENYDHQHQTVRTENGKPYGDLIQYMDFPFVAEVAALNQLLLGELAAAPAPPKSAILAGAVTPDAKITIAADDDAGRQGFELLHRETTDARWHVLRAVDQPGQVVLSNTSTDNEYFAVRSVGRNGHRSFAVPCVPAPSAPIGSVPPVPPKPPKPPGR